MTEGWRPNSSVVQESTLSMYLPTYLHHHYLSTYLSSIYLSIYLPSMRETTILGALHPFVVINLHNKL